MRQTAQDINEVVLSSKLGRFILGDSCRKFAHSNMRYATETFAQFSHIFIILCTSNYRV